MPTHWPSFARKICFGSYFFLLGVEYAVILPTINGYLISLQADNTFLGIVLASFSFAGLLTAPLYGYITDWTGSVNACIIIGNMLEVTGNFLYFVGKTKYFVLLGRVVAGLGSGAGSSVLGTVSRSTSEQERTSSFALLMALRQIGLVLGPGLNAFLYDLNFDIGPFVADGNSAPGLCMALLWLVHTLLIIIIYRIMQHTSVTVRANKPVITKAYLKTFFREEVIVLLACSFLSMFIQTGMEAAITPMTLMYFDWDGLSNSYLLLSVGALVILCFLSFKISTKYFIDRTLLIFGCLLFASSYAIFLSSTIVLYLAHDVVDTPAWVLPVFSIYVFVWVLAAAYFFVPQISLFSKITAAETQAFNQGIRMVAIRLGMTLGPLWSSPLVTITRLPILSGVNLLVFCLLIAMIIGSYEKFLPSVYGSANTTEPRESAPLLGDE